jgi:PadR family transcriptional regulator PadR
MRITMVVMDVFEAIEGAPPHAPAWGLRLCQDTGYGTGTIYPALGRLLKAGWIRDEWETPAPADRPRRRFYRATEEGRAAWRQAVAARVARREAREIKLAGASPGVLASAAAR